MMKVAVGYQLPEDDEEPLTSIVADFRDHIDEVYFPWLDMPSGRSPMASTSADSARAPPMKYLLIIMCPVSSS